MHNSTVAARFDDLALAEEIRYDAVAYIPLIADPLPQVDYALFGDLEGDAVVVEEVEGGIVGTLRIRNKSDQRVLLLEGQVLKGAMQNRALSTDVLVPAASVIEVPVNCVERGRWSPSTAKFSKSSHSPVWMRARKSARVAASLEVRASYDAVQHETWADVDEVLESLGARSPTSDVDEGLKSRELDLGKVREFVLPRFPKEAVGLVTLLGESITSVEVFDKPATLASSLPGLIDGNAIDWLRGRRPTTFGGRAPMGGAYFGRIRERLFDDRWTSRPSPGEGEDWRLRRRSLTAVSLQAAETPVHVQVFPHAWDQEQRHDGRRSRRIWRGPLGDMRSE